MVDLSVNYCGLKFKNPIICASSPATHTPEACQKVFEAGFAGVVLKTNPRDPTGMEEKMVSRPAYRLGDWRGQGRWKPIPPKASDPRKGKKLGIKKPPYTFFLTTPGANAFFREEKYLDYIKRAKDLGGDDFRVIASITGNSEKRWKEQCELINRSEADLVELNLSDPGLVRMWSMEGFSGIKPDQPSPAIPEIAEKVCKLCTDILEIPSAAKLHLQIPSPSLAAKACERSGVSGLVFANSSLRPGLRIDIETGEVGLPGFPCFQGVWGPWVALLISGNIANFRINGLKLDISGCGGIIEPEDVIRFIMAGANTVQIARTVMIEGWGIATEFLDFIQEWMEKKGYKNFDEIKGIAVDKVVTDCNQFKSGIPQIMGGPLPTQKIKVDEKKCITCGWCEAACMYLAIEIKKEYPEIDPTLCEVCGMCEAICPMRAISIIEAPKDSRYINCLSS